MLSQLAELDERAFRALTGLSRIAFAQLLPWFESSLQAYRREQYEQAPERQRQPGAGQKGKLPTSEHKFFFLLRYLKSYPTFDVLGHEFGLDRSKACTNVHTWFPVLLKTLAQVAVLPQREFASVEALRAAWGGIEVLLLDATERPVCRPSQDESQRAHYSGKRKRHTAKNTVISTPAQQILFLGYTVAGHEHDYGLFKTEFAPGEDWFETFKVWVDLGYLGFDKDYRTLELHIPHKKPRKSKTQPNPTLSEAAKAENRLVSQVRVKVENAIGRMKRFGILMQPFRNHVVDFVDDVAFAAAGLANWSLKVAKAAAT